LMAVEKPGQSELCSPALERRTPTIFSTHCIGVLTVNFTLTNQFIFTAISRRQTEWHGLTAAVSGTSVRRPWSWVFTCAVSAIRGGTNLMNSANPLSL